MKGLLLDEKANNKKKDFQTFHFLCSSSFISMITTNWEQKKKNQERFIKVHLGKTAFSSEEPLGHSKLWQPFKRLAQTLGANLALFVQGGIKSTITLADIT